MPVATANGMSTQPPIPAATASPWREGMQGVSCTCEGFRLRCSKCLRCTSTRVAMRQSAKQDAQTCPGSDRRQKGKSPELTLHVRLRRPWRCTTNGRQLALVTDSLNTSPEDHYVSPIAWTPIGQPQVPHPPETSHHCLRGQQTA